jgi:hypothetical protein
MVTTKVVKQGWQLIWNYGWTKDEITLRLFCHCPLHHGGRAKMIKEIEDSLLTKVGKRYPNSDGTKSRRIDLGYKMDPKGFPVRTAAD